MRYLQTPFKKDRDMPKTKYIWDKLTFDQRTLFVTLLWNDGYSEKAIADFFGARKGQIVGFRNRHLQHFARKLKRAKAPSRQFSQSMKIDAGRFLYLLDVHRLDVQRERGVAQTADIWDTNIPQNQATPEDIENAKRTGKVAELRPVKAKIDERSDKPDIPSFEDLPFLPPPNPPRKCSWKEGCPDDAALHSILCKKHQKMAKPGPFGPRMD
jgi:hypothetical protein